MRDAALLLRRLTTHVQAQLVQGRSQHLGLGEVSESLEAPLRVEVVGDAGPHLRGGGRQWQGTLHGRVTKVG